MDSANEPTTQELLDVAKRSIGRFINWRFVREASAMPIADLAAMSVGLSRSFVEVVEETTTPSPDTPIDELAEMLAYRDADIEEARHRRAVSFIRLSTGDGLHPANGEIDGYNTAVSVSDFAAFAHSMGWPLPPEFPHPFAASPPVAAFGAPEIDEHKAETPSLATERFKASWPTCTKHELIDCFQLTGKNWEDTLSRPSKYDSAKRQPGRKGKGGEAIWCPLTFAGLLVLNEDCTQSQVKTRFLKVAGWKKWECELLAEIGVI